MTVFVVKAIHIQKNKSSGIIWYISGRLDKNNPWWNGGITELSKMSSCFSAYFYGGWFVPCRISVFSGRKRESSPCENPPNGDFGGFSHGDLSPRQAENATHEMSRTLLWQGERSPCKNTKKSPFGGFLRGDLSSFRLAGRKVATRKPAKWWFWRVFAWRSFAPPGKDTTNRRRKGNAWKVSYFRMAGRKVAMQKHEKVTIWRGLAWRLFAYSPRKHDNTKWHKSATILL